MSEHKERRKPNLGVIGSLRKVATMSPEAREYFRKILEKTEESKQHVGTNVNYNGKTKEV